MFGGARVLIVEDEALIADDLAVTVEAAQGQVVGPFASVAAALALLDKEAVAAAILDANLPDGEVTPVALLLIECGVAVIVHTGTGVPDALRQRYPDVPVFLKPTSSEKVVDALSKMILGERPDIFQLALNNIHTQTDEPEVSEAANQKAAKMPLGAP